MFSPYHPVSDKFASLFMPLCQCTWGRYKGANMSNYTWTDSKWRPVPVKRDSCLIPNLVGTYLCGAKNWKKVCYRILGCREMGVEVLEVTITWTVCSWRSFTCIRPWSWNVKLCWFFVSLTTTKISKCAVFWIQVTDYELLWSLSRLLETEL